MDIYNIKPQFKNSLLVLLLKAAVEKISGMGDLRYYNNVVNFYSMLEATSRKGFEAVSEKLMGPCLQSIHKVNKNSESRILLWRMMMCWRRSSMRLLRIQLGALIMLHSVCLSKL